MHCTGSAEAAETCFKFNIIFIVGCGSSLSFSVSQLPINIRGIRIKIFMWFYLFMCVVCFKWHILKAADSLASDAVCLLYPLRRTWTHYNG